MRTHHSDVSLDVLRDHYLVMVGEICELARTGGLAVEVTASDGRTLSGIPVPRPVNPDDPDQVDHTGFANDLAVDGEVVELLEVVEVAIRAPGT